MMAPVRPHKPRKHRPIWCDRRARRSLCASRARGVRLRPDRRAGAAAGSSCWLRRPRVSRHLHRQGEQGHLRLAPRHGHGRAEPAATGGRNAKPELSRDPPDEEVPVCGQRSEHLRRQGHGLGERVRHRSRVRHAHAAQSAAVGRTRAGLRRRGHDGPERSGGQLRRRQRRRAPAGRPTARCGRPRRSCSTPDRASIPSGRRRRARTRSISIPAIASPMRPTSGSTRC